MTVNITLCRRCNITDPYSKLMPLIVAIRDWKEGKTSTINFSTNDEIVQYLKEKRTLGRKILRDNFNRDVEYYLLALTFGMKEEIKGKDFDFLRALAELIIGTLDDAALAQPYYLVGELEE